MNSEKNDESFTVGDLEAEAEGKGILPPGTALTGNPQPLSGEQLEKVEHIIDVGVGPELSPYQHSSSPIEAVEYVNASIDEMSRLFATENTVSTPWLSAPEISVGGAQHRRARSMSNCSILPDEGNEPIAAIMTFNADHNLGKDARNHNIGALNTNTNSNFFMQSSDESDSSTSSDDDDFGSAGVGSGGAVGEDGELKKKMREKGRRPSTTEAKRRTSLEDDDEDEDRLHKAQKDLGIVNSGTHHDADDDDGELVEVRHDEMQGVEEGGK